MQFFGIRLMRLLMLVITFVFVCQLFMERPMESKNRHVKISLILYKYNVIAILSMILL